MLFLFVVANAFAAPGRTTYQARIVKPDGYPLESNNVNFQFSILDPTGTCVIYVENYAAVNMANSGGLISFSLGSGTRTYPASSTAIESVFDNSTVSYSCQSPGIYTPVSSDIRKITMQFNDGSGWQTLPAMSINAVPYAMYANNATLLNGKADTAFAQLSTIPTCTASQALHFNGATFSCVTAGGVGTSYTVTLSDVSTALGYTPANQASVTTVTSTVGNLGTSITTITSTVSSLATSVGAITSSQWVTSGTAISYNAGWVGIGTSAPTNAFEIVSATNSVAVHLSGADTQGAAVRYFTKRATYTESLGSANPSGNNNGWSLGSIGSQNAATTRRNNLEASYWNGSAWSVPFIITASGSVGIGATNPVTKLEVSGGLRISMESATCAVSYAGTLRYNAGNVEYCNGTTWSAFGIAGAGVTGFNGSASSTQSLAFATTGTTPAVSTVNGVHTINIPLASAASVAAGLISNSDYQIFTHKMNNTSAAVIAALGYTPVAPGAVFPWSKTVAISNAEAVGGQKVLVTFPAGSQNTEVKVYTVRTMSDYGTASFVKFNLTISKGGQVAYVTAPTLEDNISNFNWYFDSSTGVAYLRFAQTSNSYSYIIQTTSTLSANPTAAVDAGTPPAFASVTPQYALGSGFGGDFYIATSGTQRLTVTASGSVGIGTVAANALLQVHGNGNNPTGLLNLSSSSSSGDGTMAKVGPYGFFNADSPGAAYYNWGARYDGDANAWVRTYTSSPNYLPYMVLGTNGRVLIGGATSSATTDLAPTLSDKFIFDIATGNFGVGVYSPNARLHLAAGASTAAPLKLTSGTLLTAAQAGAVEYDGINLYITDNTNTRRTIATGSTSGGIDGVATINSNSNITMVASGSVVVSSTVASTNAQTGALVVKGGLGISGAANFGNNVNVSGAIQSSSYLGGAHLMYLNANGSTYSNAAEAYVGGERGFVADMGGSYAWDLLKLKNVSGTQFIVASGGYTGIGTANPDRRLHIVGDGTNYGDDVFIEATNNDSTGTLAQINLAKSRGSPSTARTTILAGDTMGALAFRGYNGSSFAYGGLIKSVAETNFNSSENADLRFQTTYSGVSADRMTISAYGNVGIGASASTISSSRLVVAGNNAATLISLASATIALQNANTTSGALNTLMFSNYDGFANAAISTAQSVTGNFGNKLFLQTKSASGGAWNNNQIVLDPSGYTGMGTSAPTTFLALENNYNGDTFASVTNNFAASGALARSGYVLTNVGTGYGGYSAGMILGGVSHPTMGNQLAIFANSGIASGIQIATSSGFINFVTGGVERMRLAQNGNFGIGTSSPVERIHVDASTASTRIAISSGSIFAADGYGVSLESDTDDGVAYINLHTASMGANVAALQIRGGHGYGESAASRTIVTFRTDNGRVGIGITSAAAQLHVGGQEAPAGTTGSATRIAIQPYGHTGGPWNIIARDVGANAFLDYRYGAAGDVMTFDHYGKIGIGTFTPTQKLHVSGTMQLDGDIYGGKYGGTRGIWRFSTTDPNYGIFYTEASPDIISFSPQGGGTSTPTMAIVGSSVGIGTSAPAYTLDVVGNARATGSVAAWSDQRAKKNIETLPDSLNKILQLRGVSFDWRTDEFPEKKFKTTRDIGVIAQEVEKVFPEVVQTAPDSYKSVGYSQLVAPLIEAVKELYHKWMSDSEVLHEKVQVLEEENKAMKEYLCQKDPGAPFCVRKPASSD